MTVAKKVAEVKKEVKAEVKKAVAKVKPEVAEKVKEVKKPVVTQDDDGRWVVTYPDGSFDNCATEGEALKVAEG